MLPDDWWPAPDEDLSRMPPNDPSIERDHIIVQRFPYYADMYDGPHATEIRVWTGDKLFGRADESAVIPVRRWPYVCFNAVLRNPENFL